MGSLAKSAALHRLIDRPLTKAVRGVGAYLYDTEGKAYLDASGGAAVSCLGHSHPRVIAAVTEQVATLPFAHSSFFTTEPLERLAERLASEAPMKDARALIVCDGSEAIEAALKLARQYYVERGEMRRTKIIAREQSYHGNTLGALAIGGNVARRAPYHALLGVETVHIAPCYPYRYQRPDETIEEYGLRSAAALEQALIAAGPDTVMAFVAEPVVGATAGCLVPPPGYLARIRQICDQFGILFIADEIMCGMGRTGVLHACDFDHVSPDIITIAKGLGAGYQPIGAVLAAGHVVEALASGSGALANGHTYMGHAVACAAALAVQDVLRDEGLVEHVAKAGPGIGARLTDAFGDSPHVGDIRGRGYFWAVELVEDRASKRPFDVSLKLHARIKGAAMDLGLICYPAGGTVDGVAGDHVLVAPPFNLTEGQLDEMVVKLRGAVDAAILPLPSAA